MRMLTKGGSLVLIVFYLMSYSYGQETTRFNDKQFNSFVKKTSNQSSNFNRKINRETSRTIANLIKQEKRLERSLAEVDKLSSESVFKLGVDSLEFYRKLIELTDFEKVSKGKLSKYNGLLDSAKCLMQFVNGENLNDKFNLDIPQDVTDALQKISLLEHGIESSDAFEKYIKNRKAEIGSILSKYTPNPKYNKILKSWGKEYYYYGETMKNYQELLNNPTKIQLKVFQIAKGIPAFNDFMKENSALSSIFNSHELQDYSGLQTREQVNGQIKSQLAQLGSKGKEIVCEKIENGKEMLEKVSDEFGGSSGEQEVKDFKPNTQKTRTFWQRVEIGSDFQFNRKNKEQQASITAGLTLGFKIMDKFILGAGFGANLNAGNDWKHPVPAAEKVNFRCYSEYSIGKEFFIRGGWERSFTATITSRENFNNVRYYQESALIGISRSLPTRIKVPFLKKKMSGKIMLMYDLLYKKNETITSPLVFRVGYNF